MANLHQAARRGDVAEVRRVLDRRGLFGGRANPDGRPLWESVTPLFCAASSGHLDVVRLLLDSGASIEWMSPDGWTVLQLAAFEGETEVVTLLLERGANPNTRTRDGASPLHQAAFGGVGVAEALLDHGADVDAALPEGHTPLMYAALAGKADLAELLIERGANVCYISAATRATALHAAAVLITDDVVHSDVAHVLVQVGKLRADDLTVDRSAYAPEAKAAVTGVLLDAGAPLDVQEALQGQTALNLAVQSGLTQVVQLLLDHGADTTVGDTTGWTPLHHAAVAGRADISALLLDAGADPSAHNNTYQETPLHRAAVHDRTELAQLLVARGSDVAACDRLGRTALHLAASFGGVALTQVLLDAGIDANAKDADGRTALQYAKSWHKREVVGLLRHHLGT